MEAGEYNSMEELSDAIKQYEKGSNCKWNVRSSIRITEDDKNIVGSDGYRQKVADRLVVSYIVFECERGPTRESRAKVRATTTKKQGCEAYFVVVAFKNKLIVKDSQLKHNDFCGGRYSHSTVDQVTSNMVELLLRAKTPTKNIASYLTSETGEYYNSKDIHNLFPVRDRAWTVDEAIENMKVNEAEVWKLKREDGMLMGVLYQSLEMKENFQRYGQLAVLDSTFKLTNLNWTFFILLGIDSNLRSVPFFCFVVYNETCNLLARVFEIFVKNNNIKKTSYIITDKDLTERKVLRIYFQNAKLNLCRFHLLKAFKNKLGKLPNINKKIKECNMTFIKILCYLENPELYQTIVDKFHPEIKAYYDKNWGVIKHEFIPCFKETSLNFNIHTTNNIESYFGVLKKTIKLGQDLGNFLFDVKTFFDNKIAMLQSEENRRRQRTPNKIIPKIIKDLKDTLSNYAFQTLVDIEVNSRYLSCSNPTYIFNLELCCKFKATFGLPCIHVFYNSRTNTQANITKFIDNRWVLDNGRIKGKPTNYVESGYNIHNENTHKNIGIKNKPSEHNDPCDNVYLDSESRAPTKEQTIKNYKAFKQFGKKIKSIMENKRISQENGSLILENVCNFLETNDTKTIINLLSPGTNLIKRNIVLENKIIKNLIQCDLLKNESQKGAKKKLRKRKI
eukprot:GAHX01002874.1.p1 GENE.GAHX01002874.1~~GAHX01002874.1.p1  ORF type:complete len:675 (-),score=108.52 GAHX01002874.1:37-2061(-)